MLVEQCQPLGYPSSQNQKQQCHSKETEYTLQEHDYETHGEGNSQMAFIFVKQESVLNQDEVKSTMVCRHVLSDKADSPWASACENEKEGPFINEIYSTREIPLPQRREENQMALELPFLGTYSGLQGAQNQSSELEPSLVISLAAIKDDMEEESEVSKGSKPVNEQTDVTLQQYADVQSTQEQLAQPTPLKKDGACDELKYGEAEVEASSQPDLSVRRRRGRPPKKAKHLQPPVKEIFQPLSSDTPTEQEIKKIPEIRMEEVEVSAVDTVNITSSEPPQARPVQLKESSSIITLAIQERANTALEDVENCKVGSLAVSVASLSKRCSSEKETPSESQQFSMDMEEGAIQDPSIEVSSATETTPAESPQAPSVQGRERCTSVTLQDAMLLVEAMNQPTVKNTVSSPQRTAAAAPPQTHCAPWVGALQTVDEVPTEPQTPLLAVETHEVVGNLPITELSTTTLSTIEKCCAPPQTTDATPTSEAQAHIKVVIPKQQHTVSLSSTATSSGPPSTAATQCGTCAQSLQQHRPHLLITSVAPSRRGNAVIIVPRSVSSLMPHKIAAATQLPTVMPTVVAAQNILLPGSTAAGLPLGTSSPVRQKTISVASSKSLPVVTQLTATSTDLESGTLLHPKKTIIIPRQVSAVESRKHQSQTIVQTAQQESAKSAAPVLVSRFISLSQKLSVSVDKQTASNEVATMKSQEMDNTSDNFKYPKQTVPVSINTHTETCSSLNMSVGPVPISVSPDAQDPKKASSNDSVDARASSAETSTSGKRRLQRNSFLTQLRSHIKTHLQARRTETNAEPHAETETHTVSPKKPRLENDHPNDKNTTSEPIPLGPKTTGAVEDVKSLKRTTNDSTPISPRRTGLCKDGVKPKRTLSESSSVTSRRSKATCESSPWRSSSGRDAGFKNKKSTSVSPRRSSSTKESVTPKKTKNTSLHPRRTSSSRIGVNPKNSPSNTTATSVRPKRTNSSRDGASPEKTKSPSVSPGTSGLSKNGTSLTNESTSVSRRRCTFSKDVSCTKRESNSFSPRRCSTTTDGSSSKNTKSETNSPSVGWPKLAKDGVRLTKAGESTSVKKLSLIQDGTSLKKNLRGVNARKLGKAVKAKTIAKIKNSNQSELQNGTKTSQLVQNRASCEAAKKCMVKAVWTPPRMPTGKALPAGAKRSARLPVKKETRSPRSQDHTVVYPPSVSLHPIPVKAPPVVSPLQPLSVIGWRLLKNQCGECGRVLSSSAALESHVSLHTGRRPFSCTLCGKRFADSKALKRHGRVHRNGRIHICQQCGKGFVYRFGLTKHLQMVHRKIKPFVCQICNKGFFTKIDVEAHIRIHTGEKPFHCNLCEKKFTRRVELNVHLRWHNGEKRHWCPYCGKGFLDFNNLKRHKYIHTGEKPHSCPHCPKNFTQSGHLKKHVKNVHKIQ